MRSGLSISTTVYSKSYLAVAWQQRGQLQDYERRGFAQFVYLTICGHLEGLIAKILERRYHSIRFMLKWNELPPMKCKLNEELYDCDLKPIYESMLSIIKSEEKETYTASLSKLMHIYDHAFSLSLNELIGKELAEDLHALSTLRNLFAHGRDLFLELKYPQTFDGTAIGNIDSSSFLKAAKRLKKAGIITTKKITAANHDTFHSMFYSDAAILYFYRSAEMIEERLLEGSTFLPEKHSYYFQKLPKLEN